jgi:lipoyl(octanoyl) transferase
VEKVTCRFLPCACADGAHNMAADEVLLQGASAGQLSFRFYTWTEATVSLGYFQPSACRLADPRLRALPCVRRPTGGAALVHHHELTYALALPERAVRPGDEPWLVHMHRIIACALKGLGVDCRLTPPGEDTTFPEAVLCFQRLSAGDVLCEGAKVVGSAQRRQRHGLLQHGAILLAMSPLAPSLPGILELCGLRLSEERMQNAIAAELTLQTGWELVPGAWREPETVAIAELAERKYGSPRWNEKR